jgi:hypothetical protein
MKTMNIRITVNDSVVDAVLSDTPAAKDFLALLPLSLKLRDYASTEKVSDLPSRLRTAGSPAGYQPSVGDITYYAPWGNLAIFYRSFDTPKGSSSSGRSAMAWTFSQPNKVSSRRQSSLRGRNNEMTKHMAIVEHDVITGERGLFKADGLNIVDSVFADGESPLKHSRNLTIDRCVFRWKYPLWYAQNVTMADSALLESARSGIWYAENVTVTSSTIEAPKTFRRSRNITLDQVDMPIAHESLWHCDTVRLHNVTAKGDYFGANSTDVSADGLRLSGNYAFDGARDVTIRNSTILSKDAFWNSDNVTVYNSIVVGEYLGWNSRNLTLINCTIESLQGLCYVENLVLRNCRLLNSTLTFEYSTVDADISTEIDSVMNPAGGTIRAKGIGELILDPSQIDPTRTTIITESAYAA